MAAIYQLDFFEKSETSELKDRMQKCEESAGKVRKSLFARNNELKKRIDELESRLEIIEKGICNGIK